jgi:hypothetical protein
VKSFPAFGILLGSRGKLQELCALLEANSGLPGPRANLELVYSFASTVAGMHLEEWQWEFLMGLASTSPNKAPVNSSREYLPICALVALGALYGIGLPRPRRRAALAALTAAASDPRWRVREAAAMGLQQIGEGNPEALRAIVADWLPGAGPLQLRAVMAGLAHPPILKDRDFALFSLQTAQTVLGAITAAGTATRKDDAFRVLRQGLSYALSVFVAHAPTEGFALLRKSAAIRDPDMARIIRENLKKKRIADAFPKEVKQVALIVDEVNGR